MFDVGMRFSLGEEIDALRDMVARFAREEIAPRAAEIDSSNNFPSDLWESMGELGKLIWHKFYLSEISWGPVVWGISRYSF